MSNPSKNKPKKKNRFPIKRVVAAGLAGLLVLLFLIPYCLQIAGYAQSAAEIMTQLEDLQSNADALAQQQTQLRGQISTTQTQAMDYVEQKAVIDQMLQVTQSSIDNTQAQLQEYSLLIAARQSELDAAQARESAMYETYQDRIRAMEEYGNVSYWSVLFQAHSLSDIIDRMEMVREIAQADQDMLQQLRAVSDEIAAARGELEDAKLELETTRDALATQQDALAQQQAQSDALILAMTGDVAAMEEVSAYYDQQEQLLGEQIAATLEEYYIAAAQEEALAAAQAAAQAAQAAANDAQSYAGQAQSSIADIQSYVSAARYATTAATAQEAWDNAAWSAYLAQSAADKADTMVAAVTNETEEARRQTLTNPNAEPYIAQAGAYLEPAQAAAQLAHEAAEQATQLAATAEPYVVALKEKEAADAAAAAQAAEAARKAQQEALATQQQAQPEEDTSSTYTESYADTLGGFACPLPSGSAYVSSAYGNREHPIYGYYIFHNGVDLAANAGTQVYATKAGTVVAADYGDSNGNYVTISHAGGVSSCYLHLTSYCVSAGDSVSQGQVIGYVGSTGSSTGPHLHFSILIDGEYVNPMEYISIG